MQEFSRNVSEMICSQCFTVNPFFKEKNDTQFLKLDIAVGALFYLSHDSNESNLANIATLSTHVGSSNNLAILSVSMQICVIWNKIVL